MFRLAIISTIFGAFLAVASPVIASETPAVTPHSDFQREFKALKDSLTGLPAKIEEAQKTVEKNANPATAKGQIDALRGIVSTILSQVADNGPVTKLGHAAITHAKGKLAESEANTTFQKAQKDFLVAQWRSALSTTEAAVADLEGARKELAGLLKVLQSNEDFLKELSEVANASATVDVIKALTTDMKNISTALRAIINRMSIPSM